MLGLGPVLQLTTLLRKTLYSDPRWLYRQESCSFTPNLSSSCPSEILQRSFSEFMSLDPSCPTVQSRSFHQSASPTSQSPVNINFISVLYSAHKGLNHSHLLVSSCKDSPNPTTRATRARVLRPPKHIGRASQASLQRSRLCLSPTSGLPNLTPSRIFLAPILRQHSFVVYVRWALYTFQKTIGPNKHETNST